MNLRSITFFLSGWVGHNGDSTAGEHHQRDHAQGCERCGDQGALHTQGMVRVRLLSIGSSRREPLRGGLQVQSMEVEGTQGSFPFLVTITYLPLLWTTHCKGGELGVSQPSSCFAYLIWTPSSSSSSSFFFFSWTSPQDKDMSTCSFTPFGGGQRLCPGLDLSRLEASIFLHHLVTNFT